MNTTTKTTQRRAPWTYKGAEVYPADLNSSGIRWYCRCGLADMTLRSDTKQSMREMISRARKNNRL